MQLDRTEIVIRARSLLELLDLSLLVIRQYWWQLAVSSAMFGLPLLIIDVSLIAWMLGEQGKFALSDLEQPEWAVQNRYLLHLIALWFLQFPLASLPATVLIGNQIFFEQLTFKRLWQELKPISRRALLVLGFLRLGLLGIPLELLIQRNEPFNPFMEVVLLLVFMCGWSALRRAIAPYAPEILGLETCKLSSKNKSELSYWRRSQSLHGPIVGDCIGRLLCCGFVACVLVGMLYSLTLVGDFVGARRGKVELLNSALSNRTMLMTVLPFTIWLASIYATVFRFLAYLDSRIRLEGWEVELQLKAERNRLMQSLNITPEGQLIEDSPA